MIRFISLVLDMADPFFATRWDVMVLGKIFYVFNKTKPRASALRDSNMHEQDTGKHCCCGVGGDSHTLAGFIIDSGDMLGCVIDRASYQETWKLSVATIKKSWLIAERTDVYSGKSRQV